MPHNLYINSGGKNINFFGVRNFEGQNHSGHPVPIQVHFIQGGEAKFSGCENC